MFCPCSPSAVVSLLFDLEWLGFLTNSGKNVSKYSLVMQAWSKFYHQTCWCFQSYTYGLEGTHKDHWVQLLALHRMCSSVTACAWEHCPKTFWALADLVLWPQDTCIWIMHQLRCCFADLLEHPLKWLCLCYIYWIITFQVIWTDKAQS